MWCRLLTNSLDVKGKSQLDVPKMPKRWTAATPCSYLPAVLVMLVLPRCALSIRADKTIGKDDHVSATVNATVLDTKGNPIQMMTNDEGTYGQNSPKADAKGIVIAPAPYHGGRLARGAVLSPCPFIQDIGRPTDKA